MTVNAAGRLIVVCLAATLAACGSTEPEVVPPSLERLWRAGEAGVEETTIELRGDGRVRVVEADYTGRSCVASTGSWSSDGSRLVLRLTPPEGAPESDVRSFDYEVFEDRLLVTDGGASTTFVPASEVPSCVSYGFGTWEGTLTAAIDDVPTTFTNFVVSTERIDGGTLEIFACPEGVSPCELEDAMLILRLNADTAPLRPGNYALGTISTGFYGFINPFPDDPDFDGFDSLRLFPTGEFRLSTIEDDRVVATFEFEAKQRANNSPPAPDGRTEVLVSDGVIFLEYG